MNRQQKTPHSFHLRRYYAYAVLVAAAIAVARVGDVPVAWAILAAGGVIAIAGIIILTDFVRRYPSTPKGFASGA